MKFIALGALYQGDSPDYLDQALQSLSIQTKKIDICLVVDGPISNKHEEVILKFSSILTFVIRCNKNKGLSHALNEACLQLHGVYDYIIRFDADDINLPERFELTCSIIESYQPDLLSLSIIEFNEGEYCKSRKSPNGFLSLRDFRYKNPIFHPASAVKLKTLMELGCYEHVTAFEDWATWMKFASNNKIIMRSENIGVKFRVTDDMIKRRFGWLYLKKEFDFARHRLSFYYYIPTVDLFFLFQRLVRNLLGYKVFKLFFVRRS